MLLALMLQLSNRAVKMKGTKVMQRRNSASSSCVAGVLLESSSRAGALLPGVTASPVAALTALRIPLARRARRAGLLLLQAWQASAAPLQQLLPPPGA